nr:MAG TPA: hypothetical protein [Caudoviricetes sp.]
MPKVLHGRREMKMMTEYIFSHRNLHCAKQDFVKVFLKK